MKLLNILEIILKKLLIQKGKKKKDELMNKLRNVDNDNEMDNNDINIELIVKKLKKHDASVKKNSLLKLKTLFLENVSNGVEFLRIEGALHTLVGVVLGTDPYLQLLAVECCCNLSLGNGKTCYQVAKAATPYFVTILEGLNYNLMKTVLITVGNLCGSDVKTCRLMRTQGIIEILLQAITITELRESAFYALLFFTRTDITGIEKVDLKRLVAVAVAHMKEVVYAQWVVYHCVRIEDALDWLIEQGAPELALESYMDQAEGITADTVQSATCITRLLACLLVRPQVALMVFNRWSKFYPKSEYYFQSSYRHLAKENLWLFGNLVNHKTPELQLLVKQNGSDIISLTKAFSSLNTPSLTERMEK